MKYLHKDRELFIEVIDATSVALNVPVTIVEKDYYVSMILKLLSQMAPNCVFKGGTSLSKCYRVIDRFSEDIDISFLSDISQGKRKKFKNDVILGISNILDMPIENILETRSRRDFNAYVFSYNSITDVFNEIHLTKGVRVEVSYLTNSFPVFEMKVDSFVYQFLSTNNIDLIEAYDLTPFSMKVQSIERTFIDKVFAICDYYLLGKTKRYSRHIYDIYMLLPNIEKNDDLKKLIKDVRKARLESGVCPSAKEDIDIGKLLNEIIDSNVFKSDYKDITEYFQKRPIAYDIAIEGIREISNSHIFD